MNNVMSLLADAFSMLQKLDLMVTKVIMPKEMLEYLVLTQAFQGHYFWGAVVETHDLNEIHLINEKENIIKILKVG